MTVALSSRRAVLTPPWVKRPLWKAAREVPSWHIAPALIGDLTDLVAGQSLVTFTNSSPAWGFNSSGVLVQPAANVPFIEYDPATGACLGWRVWDAVTNLALHSRDLTQTVWVKSGITPTRDQAGADGTANMATRLTATSSDGTTLQTITSASATRVSGFLIKRITGTGVIQITQDGGATWNTVTITNQWLRYSIAAATVTNPQIGFRIRSSGDEIAVDFAQLQSSSILGPPVETGALTASSTADVASITGAAFAGIWNQAAWTVYSDSMIAVSQIKTQGVWEAAGGTYASSLRQPQGTANQFRAVVGGTFSASPGTGGLLTAGTARAAVAATGATGRLQVGDAGADITSANAPDPTVLWIGNLNSATQLNGYIRELAIWKSRRPNTNLQAMTQ